MRYHIRWLALVLCVAVLPSMGQSFPERPLRVLVGFTPGSASDIMARQIASGLSDGFGKQVIVENREGATGTIAAGIVARAIPDGHTMLLTSVAIVTAPLVIKDLTYDLFRDLAPVAMMAHFSQVLVVNSQVKANSVKDLVELAKANPGQLNYANSGRGGTSWLSVELMRSMSGINIVGIGYKLTSQALSDTISGQVPIYIPQLPVALPHIRAGRLKGLAVTTLKRSPAAPEIPTMAETLPGYEAATWYGISVPAKTPKPIIGKLHAEIVKALQLPDTRQRVIDLGGYIVAGSGEVLGRTMREERDKWTKLVREVEAEGR